MVKKQDWEKGLEKLGWAFESDGGFVKVKSFIASLLAKAKKETAQEIKAEVDKCEPIVPDDGTWDYVVKILEKYL